MDDILNAVRASLHETPAVNGTGNGADHGEDMRVEPVVYSEYQEDYQDGQGHWDYDANQLVFDDTGEGVGIEGDLDVEDD